MTPEAPAPEERSPQLADAVARVATAVAGIAWRRGTASGLVWAPGVLVTSASSVWRAPRLQLALPGGEQAEGTLRGADPATDIAIVGFEAATAPAVERAAAAALRPGDFVFAVGREPSGLVQASFGHVGAAAGAWRTWRGGRVEQLIRLDGGLYPGLAGAPVADAGGRVVGMASAAFSRHHGVVLPLATVERVVAQLLRHGRVQQGYLGIAAQPVRAQVDGAAVDGLLVSAVADGGPAAQAGLLVGDVITAAAGAPVATIEGLRDRLGADQVGGRLALTVARGGQARELALDVAERPAGRCH